MFTVLCFSIFLFSLLWISKILFRNRKREVPQAGGAWPVIGHLHLLGGPQPTHITLGTMADKYGPIFAIKLGVHKALVVSNSEIAKECLTTNDKAFANRPKSVAPEVMGYNRAIFGFAPYGPYWRQMRKIAIIELFSSHRLETLKHVRESAVRESLRQLSLQWKENKSSPVLVEMRKWFADLTLNMNMRIIVGKQIWSTASNDIQRRRRKRSKDVSEYSGKFVISDALPFLRWLDIGGEEKTMKKIAKDLDQVAMEWLKEHKSKRISGQVTEEDFMDVMLSLIEDTEEHDADTIIKATCLGLMMTSSDTTAISLTWALSLLLNNLDALKKVKDELDTHVGKDKKVEEPDIKNLVYLQAIVKETMRLYPAGPLSLPHESIEDCTVSSYHVPAGTRLFINLSKIQRDPNVWTNPDQFCPERFLTSHRDVDVKGQNFELIPFGSGRRMCPAVNLALQVTQFTLASLLHGFDIATPLEDPVDVEQGAGLTNLKATPLEVLITPRLPASIYAT